MPKRPLSPMAALFITVLLDMLSFGLVIPDLQIRAAQLGASDLGIGTLQSIFGICQFGMAPLMGRWSDLHGRKIVLLTGAVISAFSFAVYAFANTIAMLAISRILSGTGAANLSAAYATVSDISAPEDRAKRMGQLAAAFAIGFVFGPPIGGQLAIIGGNLLLGFASCSLAVAAAVFVWFAFPPLPKHRTATGSPKTSQFSIMKKALQTPGLLILLALFFVYNFAFSNLETTFPRFMFDRFNVAQDGSGLFLGYVGIMLVIVQGGLVGRISKALGELGMVRIGLIMAAPALAFIGIANSVQLLVLGAPFLCFGAGIALPGVQSLLSKSAPVDVQGGLFGITQSLGSLARIIGPLVGNVSYGYNPSTPYFLAGSLMLIPAILAWKIVHPKPQES
jgi:DHA1 family tetracycline resistance protein-like MFS transporter